MEIIASGFFFPLHFLCYGVSFRSVSKALIKYTGTHRRFEYKGSKDGIQVNCNVVAGNGLIGRVVSVGPNFSKVTAIISDNVNTSGMALATNDNLIVTGDLELMDKNLIRFSQLYDEDDKVNIGDKIVTSNISDKYLPGILIYCCALFLLEYDICTHPLSYSTVADTYNT